MIDITHKSPTLREARASAIVQFSSNEAVQAIRENRVPKGQVLEIARAAGLFAAKRTADMIPDCHPLPIEYTAIDYDIQDQQLTVYATIKTIYKTGVEVEAMHTASVVALTIYDMLKPIDKGIEIREIKLESKKGGKSDFASKAKDSISAAVIVCSDTISKGIGEDKAGIAIQSKLGQFNVSVANYQIIPDEAEEIKKIFLQEVAEGRDLIIFTGGTGLSKRDVTPDTLAPLLDLQIPGIMEAARNYGQQRTPYAMLSRGIAGVKDQSLLLTLPGSTKGAIESMDALFPQVLHLFSIFKGKRHE